MNRKQYRHLFFDLDHTLWDFETNSYLTLKTLYARHELEKSLTPDFDDFYKKYSVHNHRLWERYRNGHIRQEELRWKRMWHAMLDFKIANDVLARQLAVEYLELLPTQSALFPYTLELLHYLREKSYVLHLITNGFEDVQHAKIRNAGLEGFFEQVVTSERAMSLKPHKEIFDFALRESGAQVADSIMIGDNQEADIGGALNAGWDAIFVNHVGEPISKQPTHTVYHLKELEDIF